MLFASCWTLLGSEHIGHWGSMRATILPDELETVSSGLAASWGKAERERERARGPAD